MSEITRWTSRHRLSTFFFLAIAIAWLPWPFYEAGISPVAFLPFGPLVAALVVIGLTEGRRGYHTLGSRMIRWRVGWTWWVVALGLPLAVLAIATTANVTVWGAPAPVMADIAWGAIAVNFAVRFIDPTDGPMGEEPGFRGYALPQLQRRMPPLASGMVLGIMASLWHLPLVVVGQLPAFGLIVTFAITQVYVWLFNHTGGSVLLTLAFHVAQGTISTTALGFTGDDAARMDWLTGAMWCLIAAGLILCDRKAWQVAPAAAIDHSELLKR
jgi:CAAX protease family protein